MSGAIGDCDQRDGRCANQMKDPESKKLHELETYVRRLEAENRALRAELNKDAAAQRDSRVEEVSVHAVPLSDLLPKQKDHDQVKPHGSSILLSPDAKIQLFQTRFAGRNDLYARRWESRDGNKKGYAPVCSNEWREGICNKPRVRCHECQHRAFEPVTDGVIRKHLTGVEVVGLYALDLQSRCRFIVADFDHEGWQDDTCACRGGLREVREALQFL